MKGINYPLVSETATEFELKWPKIWQESLKHYCHHNKQATKWHGFNFSASKGSSLLVAFLGALLGTLFHALS